MIRLLMTALLILVSYPTLADDPQVTSLYYINSEAGRTPLFDKAANTPMVNVKDAKCLADNGDRVEKKAVANLFWTQVTILEGSCKGQTGYVNPSNIRRWFFSSGQ